MSNSAEEKFAKQKFNTKSLMAGYNSILNRDLDAHNEEVAEEYVNDGLMSTYGQMMDSYRQGTIDGKNDERKNLS